MTDKAIVRPVQPGDYDRWLPLWEGYNAFYGRAGETALPLEITHATWARFFDALVAEADGALLGLVHYIFHRNTIMLQPTCYLQDLFTTPAARGRGVGEALIEGVYAAAREAGLNTVYWHTQETNVVARRLYDRVAAASGFIVYRQRV
jgi:GNAT superfamily N-acetyltransferase